MMVKNQRLPKYIPLYFYILSPVIANEPQHTTVYIRVLENVYIFIYYTYIHSLIL